MRWDHAWSMLKGEDLGNRIKGSMFPFSDNYGFTCL